MPLTRWGELAYATDQSMATITNTPDTQFRSALEELLEAIAVAIISGNPTLIAAAEAAVANALTTKLALSKCVHLDAGVWVWDGPNGASATHYLIPDDTGALIARATPFPVPSASAPELIW